MLCNGLQVVMAKAIRVCSKDRNCSMLCVTLQLRICKNFSGFQAGLGFHDEKAGGGQAQGGDVFANALYPGMASLNEERHICAQLQTQSRQLPDAELEVP